MAVDLGARRRLVPSKYALRNDGKGSYSPRSWVLEGAQSLDAKEWTILRRHDRDGTLEGRRPFAEGAWTVDSSAGRAFRCFKVRQTGANAYGQDSVGDGRGYAQTLSVAGIELYGTLVPCAEWRPPLQ